MTEFTIESLKPGDKTQQAPDARADYFSRFSLHV